MYQELSSRTSDATHYDNFRRKGKWRYFKGRDEPLANEYGNLKTFSKLKNILGKNRLCDLGFDVPKGKVTPQEAVMLNRVEEEMLSTSNIAEADDIEAPENLIVQLEGKSLEDLPMHELLGLDKQLRSIRGSLKVEVAEKVKWKKESRKKSASLRKLETIQNTMIGFEKTSERELPS